MPQNLIRVKQIDQQDLSGFLIYAVQSTNLYQQIASGTINFNSGDYYLYINPKNVQSNKSFIIGSDHYLNQDDKNNNIFGGKYASVVTGESSSIVASDFSIIDTAGFNNNIGFGIFNYITGSSGDQNSIIGGINNFISTMRNNENNTILGGSDNQIHGTNSTIVGGKFNFSSGENQFLLTEYGGAVDDYAVLIGGTENSIYGGKHNSIINGYYNIIEHLPSETYSGSHTGINIIINSWNSMIRPLGLYNSILGGSFTNISGAVLSLIGGYLNKATGNYSTLMGGYSNIISGSVSNIVGGAYNTIYGNYASIIGGRDNLISGNDSFGIGRNNQVRNSGSAIISDGTNRIKILNEPNTLNIDFENQVNIYSDDINITGNIKFSGNRPSFNGSGILLNREQGIYHFIMTATTGTSTALPISGTINSLVSVYRYPPNGLSKVYLPFGNNQYSGQRAIVHFINGGASTGDLQIEVRHNNPNNGIASTHILSHGQAMEFYRTDTLDYNSWYPMPPSRNTLDSAVLINGNQTINNNKTFASDTFFTNNINVSGTGIFNSLDLSNIDGLSFSGVDITITSGIVLSTNPVFAPNLIYNTGNQNISGTKTFLNNIIYPVSPRTSGINFTPNADLYTFFDYVLTGNSTLNTPINMSNGESITILLNQDASGSRSISFNSGYLFSNGISPTLNLVPRGVDIMQVIRVNNRFFSTFATNY